jgi:D-sedoheptulose 7-phosphate isomerase
MSTAGPDVVVELQVPTETFFTELGSAKPVAEIDSRSMRDVAVRLHEEIVEHRLCLDATGSTLTRPFTQALSLCEAAIRRGGKLLFFGNGGSAADAQHLATELMIRYGKDRPAIAAIALTTDTSALTACGNDLGFEAIFERQVAGLGRPNDVAVGISCSGTSLNVLRGLRQAKAMQLHTIGLTGGLGGEMASTCDALISVPSTVTARIQEMHIMIGHALCKLLELRLGMV